MDQLTRSFKPSHHKDGGTFQSFDSLSNVVAYDTEFSSPAVVVSHHSSVDDVDFEREMKTLIKEAYSETRHLAKAETVQKEPMIAATETNTMKESSIGGHGDSKFQKFQDEDPAIDSQDFRTQQRPTPTGACSDEDVKTFHTNNTEGLVQRTEQMKSVHVGPVGVHSKHRAATTRNQFTPIKTTPFIEGDMEKHPSLIRVKSPEIQREQKQQPRSEQPKLVSHTATETTPAVVQNDQHAGSVQSARRPSSDSVHSQSEREKRVETEHLDSGVYSPSTVQSFSETLPSRPLHSSTPFVQRGSAGREANIAPVRLDLTSAEGRSRSSSEASQPVRVVTRSDSVPADLTKIMQERAHLEGQVEMISREANAALEEKARLHSMVISLQSALTAKKRDVPTEAYGRSDGDRVQLESRVTELEDAVEERGAKARELAAELVRAESRNKQLIDQMNAVQEGINSRENSVSQLKSRIQQLHTEVQTSLKVKTQLEGEIKSMKEDHEALVSAKDWYQEQLQFAQEARVQLQNELTVLQSKTVQQATVIEQLKVQNTQASHDLKYTHQVALQEKEQLARHLEVIEADMMQREAGFERIKTEQQQAEEKLHEKMEQVDSEKRHLASLVSRISEMEAELEQKKQLLKTKQDAIDELEGSVANLSVQLRDVQLVASSKEREIEALKMKYSETNSTLSETVLQTSNKDELIRQLKKDKTFLEGALRDAITEKNGFDTAIQLLKADMHKVESNFRQMKQDLSEKKQELEDVKFVKVSLENTVQQLQQQLESQRSSFEQRSVDMQGRSEIIESMQQDKEELKTEMASLKRELVEVQTAYQTVVHDKQSLEQELSNVREYYQSVERNLQDVLREKAHLEGQLEFVQVEQTKASAVDRENANLKTKVTELEARIGEELSWHVARVTELESELERCRSELKQKEKKGESSVAVLTKKLRETIEAKEGCERTLKEMQAHGGNSQTVMELKNKAEAATDELARITEQKYTLEIKLQQLNAEVNQSSSLSQERIDALEKQIDELKRQDSKRLLELERERGRLAGIQQSHSAIKQHADILEEALGRREVLLSEVKSQFEQDVKVHERKESQLKQKLQHAEDRLKKERSTGKEAKEMLVKSEKDRSNLESSVSDLKQQLTTAKSNEVSKDETDAMRTQLSSLETENHQCRMGVEETQAENRRLAAEVESLRRALSDREDRHTMFTDQVESLKWLIEQKTREVDSFANQLRLSEDRHEVEIHNFNKALKASRSELENVKTELSSTRKSKYMMQAKLSELKDALRSKVKTQSSVDKPGEPVKQSLAEIERILESDASLYYSSQPLERLRSCLAGLRGEMGELEHRLTQHTTDLETSSASWRRVEGLVQSVKEACELDVTTSSSFQQPKIESADNPHHPQATNSSVVDI